MNEEIQVIDKVAPIKTLSNHWMGNIWTQGDSPMRFNPFATKMDPDGLYILSPDKKIVLVTFIKLCEINGTSGISDESRKLSSSYMAWSLLWPLERTKKLAANDEKFPCLP